MIRYPVVPLMLLALVVACGSETSTFDTPDDADPSLDDGELPPPRFVDDDSGAPAACPSNILCGGAGACCAEGEECVEGACRPACASGVRCGSICCAAGNVCLSQACVAPGAPCQDSFDCDENEFCEPTLGKCLPQPAEAGLCQYKPPVLPFNPKVEWSWEVPVVLPDFDQVINTPIVIDLDNDKIPEVIIVTSKGGSGSDSDFSDSDPAYVRILDGRTGKEKWGADVDAYKTENQVNPRGTPAAADLDGDGTIEIVVPKRAGGLIAFGPDGSRLWVSRDTSDAPYNVSFNSVTVAIADMDNDGKAEVVAGGMVFDHTGKLVDSKHLGHQKWGENASGYGAVSIIADVDGKPETTDQHVVTGNRAIRKDGTVVWDVSPSSDAAVKLTDGYPAIADLDKDGTPELVVVAQGWLRVQDATTGVLIDQVKMDGNGQGGPPTIADFDNDGVLEMASANGTKYNVFEYDPSKPSGERVTVKWSVDTQDGSSNVTGSSVFDFEGDGSAEVVYNDECYARVYRGSDGAELFKIANSSGTIHEMPVLVDVDGDNNTEFVVVANDRNHLHAASPRCNDYTGDEKPRHGVFVFGDANDKWVRTRRIWNQHAYHITNILSDGRVPQFEPRSFTAAENNDYRVSSQGKGVYNAPDLRVDLEVSTATCPAGIQLRARVKNAGALGVPAGVEVRFYAGRDATGAPIATKKTTRALLPGESEVLVHPVALGPSGGAGAYYVIVDGTAGASNVNECLTDNNGALAGGVRCPGVK